MISMRRTDSWYKYDKEGKESIYANIQEISNH